MPSRIVPWGSSKSNGRRRAGMVFALVMVVLILPRSASASGPCEDPPMQKDAGIGMRAAAWILTGPYTAVKGLLALSGGVISVPVYVFSIGNESVTRAVWLPAVSGTFVLTPAHLSGEQPIRFLPRCPGA